MMFGKSRRMMSGGNSSSSSSNRSLDNSIQGRRVRELLL
jgi:hypothetical protein